MRAIEVISTIDWIAEQSGDFRAVLIQVLDRYQRGSESERSSPSEIYELVHRHGRLMDVLSSNPSAVEVITAFGLEEKLLQPKYLLGKLARDVKSPHEMLGGLWTELRRPLEELIAVAKPLSTLVIPAEMQTSGPGKEDILSVNLNRETLDLAVVMKTMSDLESLYDAVNRIHGNSAFSPLQILKIESGTSLTVNLKGLGEVIKQLKELIIEVWTKHRQKRVDEILDHHKVMASGIKLIDEIEKCVRKKSITPEDGTRFKRSILKDTLSLFGNGALIEEIPAIEKVNNLALLGAFGPKLLAAPGDDEGTASKAAYAPLEEDEDMSSTMLGAAGLPKTSAISKKRPTSKKKPK